LERKKITRHKDAENDVHHTKRAYQFGIHIDLPIYIILSVKLWPIRENAKVCIYMEDVDVGQFKRIGFRY